MLKTALMILLVAMMAGPASSVLDTVWTNTYGGSDADGFRSAISTSDGGVVAVGYTYSFGAGDVDLFAVRTDASGDTLWTRTFGGPAPDYGYGVCETDDGTYVLAGFTMSSGAGGEDVYLVRVDEDGGTIWTRTYGGAGLDQARSVCFTSDGHILVAGQTESFGAGLSDAYLLKIEVDGDTLWTRTIGGARSDWADAVCETEDGCYGGSGTTGSYNTTRDAFMFKVNPAGAIVWQNRYGSSAAYREDYGAGVCALPGGGMAATGWRTDQDQLDPCQVSLLLVGSGGVQQDYRRYTDPYIEYGSSICATADGGYLICGASKSTTTHRNDLFLLRRGPGTGWLWSQTLGGPGSDWGCSVVGAGPGYYIVAGYTEVSGGRGYDGWLLKLSESEAAVPNPAGTAKLLLDAPRPNPFCPMTTMRFSLADRTTIELAVYDVGGRRVAVLAEGARDPGDHVVTWWGTDDRGEALGPGVYWARLIAGGAVATRQIVRLK